MVPGFDPTLMLWLNLVGTFVFGLSGGLAAVRARLDAFGVVVLAAVVALAGGIIRDLLIGEPPATFRDWRYLAAVGAAGLVSFFAGSALDRIRVECWSSMRWAGGLLRQRRQQGHGLRARSRAGDHPRDDHRDRGGMLRDGCSGTDTHRAATGALRHTGPARRERRGRRGRAGQPHPGVRDAGRRLCFATRMIGVRYDIDIPTAPIERRRRPDG